MYDLSSRCLKKGAVGLLGEVYKGATGNPFLFTPRGRGFRASRPCTWVPQVRKRLPPHYAVFLTEWSSSPPKFFHPKP